MTFYGCLHCGQVVRYHSTIAAYCQCTGGGIPMITIHVQKTGTVETVEIVDTVDCGEYGLNVVTSWG